MPHKLEIIVGQDAFEPMDVRRNSSLTLRSLTGVAVVFLLIMAAVWTPQGRPNAFFSISAAACVVAFAVAGPWTSGEMGLAKPLAGVGWILLVGFVLCGAIWAAGLLFRSTGPAYAIPWTRSWQYAIWALVQEFILQAIFFIRLESVYGSRRAAILATSLYAIAHIPSPLLTSLSFFGGLVFCELFRRFRNVFPIGIVHAALGLTIAGSFPDKWLHHMRVGVGYLVVR